MKNDRQSMILEIISQENIETQEQLLVRLQERGITSTQATISRDIKQMHLIKEPVGHGVYKYAVSGNRTRVNFAEKLRTIFRESITSIDSAQNIVVIKTMPGLASAACAALDDIRNAVHLGGLAAVPELIEGYSVVFELLRDHAERAACAGKARRLGKTAEFDCALLGPFDLKNAVGHVRIGDKCFICRVIEKDGLILQRIIHPFFQSFLCNTHSGGIVWETQIDHVHRLLRDLRQEAVFLFARHVHNLAPTFALYIIARTSGHDVGVHIDRVDRVTDSHHVVKP